MQKSERSRSSAGATSLHYGYVSAVDEQAARCRVRVDDLDGVETFWLPIPQARVKDDQALDLLDIGDFVGLLLDEKGEQGIIIGAFYSAKNPPPIASTDKWFRRFGDGSELEFDRSTGVLRIDCTRVDITCTQESTINAKAIAVIGAMDNDTESNGPDALVSSGQL